MAPENTTRTTLGSRTDRNQSCKSFCPHIPAFRICQLERKRTEKVPMEKSSMKILEQNPTVAHAYWMFRWKKGKENHKFHVSSCMAKWMNWGLVRTSPTLMWQFLHKASTQQHSPVVANIQKQGTWAFFFKHWHSWIHLRQIDFWKP